MKPTNKSGNTKLSTFADTYNYIIIKYLQATSN